MTSNLLNNKKNNNTNNNIFGKVIEPINGNEKSLEFKKILVEDIENMYNQNSIGNDSIEIANKNLISKIEQIKLKTISDNFKLSGKARTQLVDLKEFMNNGLDCNYCNFAHIVDKINIEYIYYCFSNVLVVLTNQICFKKSKIINVLNSDNCIIVEYESTNSSIINLIVNSEVENFSFSFYLLKEIHQVNLLIDVSKFSEIVYLLFKKPLLYLSDYKEFPIEYHSFIKKRFVNNNICLDKVHYFAEIYYNNIKEKILSFFPRTENNFYYHKFLYQLVGDYEHNDNNNGNNNRIRQDQLYYDNLMDMFSLDPDSLDRYNKEFIPMYDTIWDKKHGKYAENDNNKKNNINNKNKRKNKDNNERAFSLKGDDKKK